jgi:hypothetical protein
VPIFRYPNSRTTTNNPPECRSRSASRSCAWVRGWPATYAGKGDPWGQGHPSTELAPCEAIPISASKKMLPLYTD